MNEDHYSHLDFSETKLGGMLYQDRGMLKFQGFILSEHTDQQKLTEELRELVDRPFPDEQAMQDFMFTLNDAKSHHKAVRIEVFEQTDYRPKNIYDFTRYDDKGVIAVYESLVPISFDYSGQKIRFEGQGGEIYTYYFSDILNVDSQ
ncbi:YolD-like family protein [Listeria costaricensis]|uniref:YolD-like family protein n=1 Tax=Listeria costaricensis TaxID=2026604 RepID=UPI000C07FB08|nr:YolD-like family protein [Listeria costaricensis]